jgi:hypothetical protein
MIDIQNQVICYIHGSVHRDSILVRYNEMQQYAGVYLLHNYSKYFVCLSQLQFGVLLMMGAIDTRKM